MGWEKWQTKKHNSRSCWEGLALLFCNKLGVLNCALHWGRKKRNFKCFHKKKKKSIKYLLLWQNSILWWKHILPKMVLLAWYVLVLALRESKYIKYFSSGTSKEWGRNCHSLTHKIYPSRLLLRNITNRGSTESV